MKQRNKQTITFIALILAFVAYFSIVEMVTPTQECTDQTPRTAECRVSINN